MMNKVNLIGYMVNDPSYFVMEKTNKRFIVFTIAVPNYTPYNQVRRKPTYINCIAWEQAAGVVAKHIKKGQQFGIHGRIENYEYVHNNKINYLFRVVADQVYLLGMPDRDAEVDEDDEILNKAYDTALRVETDPPYDEQTLILMGKRTNKE
jgi:single-stranded DNA-binding protein